jgi:hypothetical protein
LTEPHDYVKLALILLPYRKAHAELIINKILNRKSTPIYFFWKLYQEIPKLDKEYDIKPIIDLAIATAKDPQDFRSVVWPPDFLEGVYKYNSQEADSIIEGLLNSELKTRHLVELSKMVALFNPTRAQEIAVLAKEKLDIKDAELFLKFIYATNADFIDPSLRDEWSKEIIPKIADESSRDFWMQEFE